MKKRTPSVRFFRFTGPVAMPHRKKAYKARLLGFGEFFPPNCATEQARSPESTSLKVEGVSLWLSMPSCAFNMVPNTKRNLSRPDLDLQEMPQFSITIAKQKAYAFCQACVRFFLPSRCWIAEKAYESVRLSVRFLGFHFPLTMRLREKAYASITMGKLK